MINDLNANHHYLMSIPELFKDSKELFDRFADACPKSMQLTCKPDVERLEKAMSKSETPETDAVVMETWNGKTRNVVDADFARKLERRKTMMERSLGKALKELHVATNFLERGFDLVGAVRAQEEEANDALKWLNEVEEWLGGFIEK